MKIQPSPIFVVANYRMLPTTTTVPVQNIYPGARLRLQAWGGIAEPAKPGALRQALKKLEPPTFLAASGTVLVYADKANTMPVDALSHAIQQTPVFHLTDASAKTLASQLKEAAGSSPGHYLIIGASGGLVGMAIGSFFYPEQSLAQSVLWFVGGAVVVVAIVALLAHFGVLSETPTVR